MMLELDVKKIEKPIISTEAVVGEEKEEKSTATNNFIFQALGIIKGDVTLQEKESSINIKGKQYPLIYTKRTGMALAKQHSRCGGLMRLTVYPRVIHFPERDRNPIIKFQVVSFITDSRESPVAEELGDFEFKLSGVWQYIPCCRKPCITVFRNCDDKRLEAFKKAEPEQQKRIAKASHIPLIWWDAPVDAFKFNPRQSEQMDMYFVGVRATFDSEREVFRFVSLRIEPTKKKPRYLKFKDKNKKGRRESKGASSEGTKPNFRGRKASNLEKVDTKPTNFVKPILKSKPQQSGV